MTRIATHWVRSVRPAIPATARVAATFLLLIATTAASASTDSSVESPYRSRQMLAADTDGTNWAAYGRTYDESHFSPLTQLYERSVTALGLAWSLDLPVTVSERLFRESMLPRIAPVTEQLILSFIAEKVLDLPKSY